MRPGAAPGLAQAGRERPPAAPASSPRPRSVELLAQEAQLLVAVRNITGVVDSSVLDPEPGPEGPFVTYSYYVTYDFLEEEEAEAEAGEASKYGEVLAEVRVSEPGPGQSSPLGPSTCVPCSAGD